MPVLPLILAPAALMALTPQPAGPIVGGMVLDQTGKPVPASLGLIPMFQRDEPFPARTVENRTVKTKKADPGFRIPAPAPGLYLLDVRAKGYRPLQVPVLVGEEGPGNLELTPIPEKLQGEAKPVSADPRLLKLVSLYSAQKAREADYRAAIKARLARKSAEEPAEAGPDIDWTADLAALAGDLAHETDPDVLALAAASYLELGTMMARLEPGTAALALDALPASSPWWAFNPRMAGGAFAVSGRSGEWDAFREALARDNPDREVRAYGLYSQMASAYHKGDQERFSALMESLSAGYKDTKFAKSAKAFDPAKMPPPPAAPEPAEPLSPSAAEPAPAPVEESAPAEAEALPQP